MSMDGPSDSHHAQRGEHRTLIAGIGNIFMGDDGFGCEIVQRLNRCNLPENVDLVDFGIRGMDLGYALIDGYAQAILIDTVEQGGAPGSVYVIEPEIDDWQVESGEERLSPHGMDPARVLRFIASLGDKRPRVLLVACEPETLGGEAGYMGLSPAVAEAVEAAVTEVQTILANASGDDAAERPNKRRVSA